MLIIERGYERVHAADGRDRECACTVRKMKHRPCMEIDAICVIAEGHNDIGGVHHQIAVAQHRAFGLAGCPAGVKDPGDVGVAIDGVRNRR